MFFFLDSQETSNGPHPHPFHPPYPNGSRGGGGNGGDSFSSSDAPYTPKKLREDGGRKKFSFLHLKSVKKSSCSSLQGADGSGGGIDPIEWLYGDEEISPPYLRGGEGEGDLSSISSLYGEAEKKMMGSQMHAGGGEEEGIKSSLRTPQKEEEKGDEETRRRTAREGEDGRSSTRHVDCTKDRKMGGDQPVDNKDPFLQLQKISSSSSSREDLEARQEKTNPFAADGEEEGERRCQQISLSDMTLDHQPMARQPRAMGAASCCKNEERTTGVLSSSSSSSSLSSSTWKTSGVGGAIAQLSRFAFLKKITTTTATAARPSGGALGEGAKEEESGHSASLHPTSLLDTPDGSSRHLSSLSSPQPAHLRLGEMKSGEREKEGDEEQQRRLLLMRRRRGGRKGEEEEERDEGGRTNREGEGGTRAAALPMGDAKWERASDLFRSAVAYHLELLCR